MGNLNDTVAIGGKLEKKEIVNGKSDNFKLKTTIPLKIQSHIRQIKLQAVK